MQTADAVVIGGGIIGTSIAYRLSTQGKKVILVEKGTLAHGTSSACDKAVFLQSKKTGIHLELARASLSIYQQLEEELETSVEFHQSGGMIAIETEQQLDLMKDFVQKQQEAGIEVELIEVREARKRQPALAPHLIGATWSKEDADVNPYLVTFAFAQAAQRLGMEIWPQAEVVGILSQHGQVTGVQTKRGTIATEIVINAAGPHAPAIGRMAGVDIPIVPRRGIIMISEKLPKMVYGNLLCAQYLMAKHLAERSNMEKVNPFGIGLSLGQTDSGTLLIGGSREYVGFQRSYDKEVLRSIAENAARLIPFLRKVRVIRTMVGFRPSTGDGLPIIAEAAEMRGFYIAAGHEGDGIALAPITGVLMANLIEGKGPYFHLLNQLGLDRFNDRFREYSSPNLDLGKGEEIT